jgi:prepilin-type N-terminal cleavage/methylation domain-containing protein/prepilin-type processing-associated H-X9-DG protein
MKKRGFTLIELLVVIAIIAMLLAILMPALNKVKKIAQRVVCGTNLKGLGTAQTVYANDYDDEYVVQGGKTNPNWSNQMQGAFWYAETLPWNDTSISPQLSIGTTLYLLVREADVSPKSFVCPASNETAFDGKNDANRDIVQLWDFGPTPYNHVSYSYHTPYKGTATTPVGNSGKKNRFAADGTRSAAFAVMADKNPFYDERLNFVGSGATQTTYMGLSQPLNISDTAPRHEILVANAQPHDREGQNVLFADGHSSYETRTDVGVKNDNIYTRWTSATPAQTTQTAWRQGLLGTSVHQAVPMTRDDSMLVNDKSAFNTFPHTGN